MKVKEKQQCLVEKQRKKQSESKVKKLKISERTEVLKIDV